MKDNYLSSEQFDLMTEEQLDCLDFDFNQSTNTLSNEEVINRMADMTYFNKIARNGMTYEFIELLNNKMFELEWKS